MVREEANVFTMTFYIYIKMQNITLLLDTQGGEMISTKSNSLLTPKTNGDKKGNLPERH